MNTLILLGFIIFAALAITRDLRGSPTQSFGSKPKHHAPENHVHEHQKRIDEELQQAYDSMNPLHLGSAAWNAEQARKLMDNSLP